MITSVSPYGYVELQDNESNKNFIVNGQRVKHYLESNFEQECSKLRLDLSSVIVQLKRIKKRLLGGNPVISRLSILFNKSLIHILKG